MRVSGAFDLPCLWAPLQSVTAVTSRRPLRAFVALGGPASRVTWRSWRSTAYPVPGHPPEGGCWVSVAVLGQAPWGGGARMARAFCRHEWRQLSASFTASEPKNQVRSVLGVARPTEVGVAASKSPCRSDSAEAGAAGSGDLRFPGLLNASPKRDSRAPFFRRRPPTVVTPKCGEGARHAAGIERLLPWGSVPFGV